MDTKTLPQQASWVSIGRPTQSRVYRDGEGRILKHFRGGNRDAIVREWEFMKALDGLPYFPMCYELGDDYILMEDLGDTEPLTDLEGAMQHGLKALEALREAGIRHNDLAQQNVIVRGNCPRIVDFGRSQKLSDPPAPGYYPDSYLLVTLASLYMQETGRRE